MVIAVLSGCSMGHKDPVEIKQALNEAANQANSKSLDELPESVQADLMPDLEGLSPSDQPTIKRFRVQANGVQAKAFFASLVKGTEFSAAIHPNVEGRITVNLT
ncbi:pilus (MSHA type) biogenesis protein MshL, partial [Vibrio sp. 10N.222.49.C9]